VADKADMAEVTIAVLDNKVDHLEKEIKKLEKEINSQGRSINRLGKKVFDGFGNKIDAVNDRIDVFEQTNGVAHTEMKKVLGGLAKFGATALVLIFLALITILGSIWLHDREEPRQTTEMQIDAPTDTNLATQ